MSDSNIRERLTGNLRILQEMLGSGNQAKYYKPELDSVLCQIQKDVDEITSRLDEIVRERTRELQSAREDLLTADEELTAVNEELKATSEEFIATNQELSAANEELAAVNEQLRLEIILRQEAEEKLKKSHQEISNILESITDAFFAVDQSWRFIYVNSEAECIWRRNREELTGKVLWEEFPEAVNTLFHREYHMAMSRRKAVHFEGFSSVLKKWIEVHAYPFREGLSVYFRDISQRKFNELNLKTQNKRLQILSETANHLLLCDDPGEIIDTLFKKLSDYLELDVYFNFIYDESKQKLRLAGYSGMPEELAQKCHWLDLEQVICGIAVLEGRRIIIENLHQSTDPRAEIARSLGIKAYVCHPLISRGRLIGALSFGVCKRAFFEPEELALMQTVCDQVAISLERAHLISQLEQNALNLLVVNNQLKSEIAERRRAEEKLKLNQSRLEALVRLNKMTGATIEEIADFVLEEGVRLTGSDVGFIGFLNEDESVMTMHSCSRMKMESCSIKERPIVYPVDGSGLWAETLRCRKPFISNDYTAPHRAKKGLPDGHILLSRFMTIPVFNGDRMVILAGVANKDEGYDGSDVLQLTLLMSGLWEILQRRKAEEELHLSNERFARSFNASPVMMAIAGCTNWRFIDANEAFLRGAGFSREEVLGRTTKELNIWADNKEQILEINKILSVQGAFYNKEVRFRTKSGDIRIGLASADTIYINSEPCVLGVMLDITEKRHLEREIARLERFNLVGQMAAGIGHEIRNPMTAVRGFLQLLGSRKEYGGYRHYFDLMIGELDRANSIITEYLTLARNKPVDLAEHKLDFILQVLRPLIMADAMNAGVDVEMKLEDVPVFPLNENEIRQLILNLVRNGIEAMPAGGTLTIRTYREGEEVVLSVRDQGRGMDEDVVEKLGTPFFTTKDNGTGLGLAVCYSIATRHNACIDIETSRVGTTFIVRFSVNTRS
ncbi:MAG: GAF domain-containing protein [Bacillota bacterium]